MTFYLHQGNSSIASTVCEQSQKGKQSCVSASYGVFAVADQIEFHNYAVKLKCILSERLQRGVSIQCLLLWKTKC